MVPTPGRCRHPRRIPRSRLAAREGYRARRTQGGYVLVRAGEFGRSSCAAQRSCRATNNFIWTAIFLTVPVSIALLIAAALLMSPPLSRAVVQPIIFLPRILAVAVSVR